MWDTFFRQLHKAGTVPSALNLTTDETRFLQMQLEQYSKSNEECQRKIESLRPLVGVAPNQRDQREAACDSAGMPAPHARHSRSTAGRGASRNRRVAIASWVENLKTGIEISVPKRELAHFRQPR